MVISDKPNNEHFQNKLEYKERLESEFMMSYAYNHYLKGVGAIN